MSIVSSGSLWPFFCPLLISPVGSTGYSPFRDGTSRRVFRWFSSSPPASLCRQKGSSCSLPYIYPHRFIFKIKDSFSQGNGCPRSSSRFHHLPTIHFHLSFHQFRNIERIQETPVKIRRLLRHYKRLAAHTVCIDMYQIRMSIQPVYPTAAEYQPPTVTAPGMITFYIPTVGSCHRNTFPGMQIHQVQIGILVPDREITIRGSRKHQKSAIRRYPRERNTLFQIIGGKETLFFRLSA